MVWFAPRDNRIVSIAKGAFFPAYALQATPAEFAQNNANWTDSHGIGLWLHEPGHSYFGGSNSGQDWKNLPLLLAPNPVKCEWVGPNVSSVDCSFCDLGYETVSESNTTCVQPEFRPYRKWGHQEQAQLKLQDERDFSAARDKGTGRTVLHANRTYTIAAPALEPKEDKFAGYAQPFTKIHYELDFLRGAEVDIGCGTSVVGDATNDTQVPKSDYAHPNSCREVSYQWLEGRGNLNAKPPELGYFPQRCQRYHRFNVTRPGKVTFVSTARCNTWWAAQPGVLFQFAHPILHQLAQPVRQNSGEHVGNATTYTRPHIHLPNSRVLGRNPAI